MRSLSGSLAMRRCALYSGSRVVAGRLRCYDSSVLSREEPGDGAAESRICRSCGLCCEALLHARAEVPTEERDSVEQKGFATFSWRDRFAFALPCSRLAGTECAIYPDRPSVCGKFRCRLLHAFDAEEISLEESLAVVRRARELWSSVTREVGAARSEGVWTAVARHTDALTGRAPSPTLGLHSVALLTLIRRRFASDDFEPYR